MRYAMAWLQGVKLFNAAAGAKPPHADIVEIPLQPDRIQGRQGQGDPQGHRASLGVDGAGRQAQQAGPSPRCSRTGSTTGATSKEKTPIDQIVDTGIVEEAAKRLKEEKARSGKEQRPLARVRTSGSGARETSTRGRRPLAGSPSVSFGEKSLPAGALGGDSRWQRVTRAHRKRPGRPPGLP